VQAAAVTTDPHVNKSFGQSNRSGVALGQAIEAELGVVVAAAMSLSEAIRLALESNPDVQSAIERTRIADAVLCRARAEFYPRLGFAHNYSVSNTPSTTFMFFQNQGKLDFDDVPKIPDTLDDFHTQLYLRQGVYTGGRRTAQVRSAEAERDASFFSLASIQNELVFRVAEAYYRLIQANRLVSVRIEAVGQVEAHLELVRSRFECGTAVKSELLAVEVRLAEVRESLITARNQVDLAWAVLQNVTGARIPRHDLPPELPPAPWSERIQSLEGAIAEALERRPETAELANRRRSAEQEVNVARSGWRPTVDLVADHDTHSGDLTHGNDSFFVGIAVRLELFNGGRTDSEVRHAVARLRELEARHARVLLDIKFDVQRAYLQLEDAKERVAVSKHAIVQGEENLRETEARYRTEAVIITQLIDAQVGLSNAHVRHANAEAEVEISRAALERALGRLTSAIAPQ
jgi:TolC family type I secretion outer membrane protein